MEITWDMKKPYLRAKLDFSGSPGKMMKPQEKKNPLPSIDNFFEWYFMYGEALQAVERGPNSIQFYIVWFHYQNKMDLISF